MHIPSYQIHNVLHVYIKQLIRAKTIRQKKAFRTESYIDKINITAEGKRQSIVNKVASNIIERITRSDLPKGKLEKSSEFNKEREYRFVFNMIDNNNKKTTKSLSMEEAGFLFKGL
ncbi:MAG: DVU0524 family FlgM-associated protein [Thermodesulfobacteriota bacterium]|nr:DVU0524 family FlgM-associated protein [Thermodesulfobacteriota bacterium]